MQTGDAPLLNGAKYPAALAVNKVKVVMQNILQVFISQSIHVFLLDWKYLFRPPDVVGNKRLAKSMEEQVLQKSIASYPITFGDIIFDFHLGLS